MKWNCSLGSSQLGRFVKNLDGVTLAFVKSCKYPEISSFLGETQLR